MACQEAPRRALLSSRDTRTRTRGTLVFFISGGAFGPIEMDKETNDSRPENHHMLSTLTLKLMCATAKVFIVVSSKDLSAGTRETLVPRGNLVIHEHEIPTIQLPLETRIRNFVEKLQSLVLIPKIVGCGTPQGLTQLTRGNVVRCSVHDVSQDRSHVTVTVKPVRVATPVMLAVLPSVSVL